MSLNTISTSSIVDGQVVYASHVLRIINALDGTASNSILINGDVKQGTTANTTNGLNSHAEGNTTVASGGYSHAEGYTTTASGPSAHAEGYNTVASGNQAHAEGGGTVASGNYSHAEGNNTSATGNNAHAEGESTTATGQSSHASGLGTVAYSNYQIATGQYNKTTNTSDFFVVGVGSLGSPKDGLGVNATRTYVSNSLYLPDLTNVSKARVVTVDTDGRLFYQTTSSLRVDTASVALTSTSASYALTSTSASYASFALTASYVIGGGGGGTGSATPGGPNNSVQFNSGGVFSGSSNFTYSASTLQMYYTGAIFHYGAYTLDGGISANSIGNPTNTINQLTASYAMTASYAQSTYNNLASGTTYGKVYHTTPIVDFNVTHVNDAALSLGNNIMTLTPLEIKKPKVLDEIIISVESSIGAGNEWTGSVRLGVYTDNGNMYPGSLIYETGRRNVSGSASIPDIYISASNINTPISAGIIWLAYIGSGSNVGIPNTPLRPWGIDQNAITTVEILNAFLGHKFVDIGGGTSYMSSIIGLYLSSSVSSSFPSTFPTNASASTLLLDGVATPFVYFSA